MNIVFMGSSKFGLKCLKLLGEMEGFRVNGVITAPETFSISYRPEGVTNVLHADLGRYCRERNVPCSIMGHGMNDAALFRQTVNWNPDIFVVAGWYHMVTRKWRELAPAYGLHASLLPDYSGGAPLVWAMINGENKTGITLFQFDNGVDSGPVLGQKSTSIEDSDTIATLYARIEKLGLDLLREKLPGLADGSAMLISQDESKRRIFPQRSAEDGIIDWHRPATCLYNFVRAQTRPYPGAFTTWQGETVTIWSARSVEYKNRQQNPSGIVVEATDRFLVATGSGLLEIEAARYAQEDFKGAELGRIIGAGQLLGT